MKYPSKEICGMIKLALTEDIGPGDATSELLVPNNACIEAEIIAKEHGIVCGTGVIEDVYAALLEDVAVDIRVEDCSTVCPGELIAVVDGPARAVLSGERVCLNFLCHLSGIATAANQFNMCIEGTACRVLDTRKTIPGLRMAEKYAVYCGGGENHRIGLWDMILIKENHIEAAGGLREALGKVYSGGLPDVPVEIEVKNLDELRTALEYPLDRIMLDNFEIADMKRAIAIRRKSGKSIPFEASGGITLDNCREYAETGIEYISSGGLTHSVKALDISMIAVKRYEINNEVT